MKILTIKNLVFMLLTLTVLEVFTEGLSIADDAHKAHKKTQKVDFDSEMIEGQARHPDGSYVVQKRGVDFVPLYKVREGFDENIKASVNYLK